MSLRLVHRRLAILMGFAGLLAFAVGAGFEPLSAILAAVALGVALFWQPERALSVKLERMWLPLAALLVARALFHVFVVRDDVVIPVVDLLLLLMAAEALRSLDAPNDVRLYALSFALILAATAYRPGVVFLVAFVAYVVLATVALMVGHLRRQAERHRVRDVPLGRGLLTTTTALSGVTLLVSVAVFLTFPRVTRGWAERGEAFATSIAGFSDEVSIGEHGSRIYSNPEVVLRVEFPDGVPDDYLGLHWRGRSYDHFDGVRWTRSRSIPPSLAPGAWYRDRWTGPVLEQKIFSAPLDVRVLFALHPTLDIDPESRIQPLFDNVGDYVYWGSGAPAYRAFSRTEIPPAAALRDAESGFRPSGRHYLQLPPLDGRIQALADSLTAGAPTRYDRVMAIQRHLGSFEYTLELPATARQATLEHFLFDRREGHCEYFSTAMVVLLRAAGVESRNVNGFLGGMWNDLGAYLAVSQNEAHSWVEVWFPGYGWVPFDPTPGGSATAAAAGLAWFWPGRIFFDGLQHRWGKWVLDYSLDSQAGLFEQWAGLFQDRSSASEAQDPGSGRRSWALWGALLLAALGVGFWRARGGGASLQPHVQMYLRLRSSCERAGMALAPGVTPLALLGRIRAEQAAAADPAGRLVDLYLRGRFGRESLGGPELRQMQEALAAARQTLRRRPRDPKSR